MPRILEPSGAGLAVCKQRNTHSAFSQGRRGNRNAFDMNASRLVAIRINANVLSRGCEAPGPPGEFYLGSHPHPAMREFTARTAVVFEERNRTRAGTGNAS